MSFSVCNQAVRMLSHDILELFALYIACACNVNIAHGYIVMSMQKLYIVQPCFELLIGYTTLARMKL